MPIGAIKEFTLIYIFGGTIMNYSVNAVRNIAVFCCLLFVVASVQSEEKAGNLDLYVILGYGVPIGGYLLGTSVEVNDALVIVKAEDHYINFGHGIKIDLGTNYYISNYLGMRIGLSYTGGAPKNKITYKDANDSSSTEKYSRRMIGLKAMIVPRFEMFGLLDMYAGVGLGLSFAGVKIKSEEGASDGKIKVKPGFSFNGLLGSEFPISKRLSFFGELSFDAVSFTMKSKIGTGNPSQTDFEKDSNTSLAPNKIPGSNLGFRVGINFNIMTVENKAEVF